MEYNSERPHESLNNLTPEEYRLMAENAEISKSAWNQNGCAYTGPVNQYGCVVENIYMQQEALSHLRKSRGTLEDENLARLSPLIHDHINMLGHYTFSIPNDIMSDELMLLNFNMNNELISLCVFFIIGSRPL